MWMSLAVMSLMCIICGCFYLRDTCAMVLKLNYNHEIDEQSIICIEELEEKYNTSGKGKEMETRNLGYKFRINTLIN